MRAALSLTYNGNVDIECDMLVLAQPGGYSAAFRSADSGLKRFSSSATPRWRVCLNVGCIPSKAF